MTLPPLERTHSQQRRAWYAITALGQHTWSDDVGRGTTSPPLGSTHGQPSSGMALHHCFWTAHTVKRRQAWHVIIAFGQHTRPNDIGCGMKSPPLDSTHYRQWRAWHAITALGLHARSDNIGRGMTSSPLDSTHGRQRRAWYAITALGQHTWSDDVGRGMTSPPFDSTHGRQRRVWHDNTSLGQHARSAMSGVA